MKSYVWLWFFTRKVEWAVFKFPVWGCPAHCRMPGITVTHSLTPRSISSITGATRD